MKRFLVGKIVNAHGLKGEVKVYPYSEYKEKFEEYKYIFIDNEEKKRKIKNVKYHKQMVILNLEGIDHIDQVEEFKNKDLFVNREDLDPISDDEFYVVDIIGCEVIDNKLGRIGIVKDYLMNTAQDIFLIKKDNKEEVLIPNVPEFIKKIDIENKTILIEAIEGLI